MDRLVDSITELVLKELSLEGPPVAMVGSSLALSPQDGGDGSALSMGQESADASLAQVSLGPTEELLKASSDVLRSGPKVLVVPGPESVEPEAWRTLAEAKVAPSFVVWQGFSRERALRDTKGGGLVEVAPGWMSMLSGVKALVLLGSDLGTLGALAALGAGGIAPSSLGVAAVAMGLPVFCGAAGFESVRRHSARLAPGFVRAFEEAWRLVASFGIELGGVPELSSFLGALGHPGNGSSGAGVKNQGRDVVTTEDVEAARRLGQTILGVSLGTIVTPLARQRAQEWGIEVKVS